MYKKIGIISREEKQFNQNYKVFNDEIVKVINKYNCLAVGIIVDFEQNPDVEFNKIKKLINFCDGIILQGGDNLYEIDKKIVKYLYDRDIPTLGICLGMQIMAISFGGEFDALKNSNHLKNDFYVHQININKDSKLYEIINDQSIVVNSRHKDFIKHTNLSIGAISGDYVIEEVEDKNKTFFVGVQWHPETIFFDKNSLLLFNDYFKTIKKA